jgi:RimJ/RimL family protein N-acetyltransferase
VGNSAAVRLAVVTDDLRDAVLALRPRPGQELFSGVAASTLPPAEADPHRTPFAVLADGEPVGFGVLDRVGYLAELVDDVDRAVLLRAFYLDAGAQGRGLGTSAVRALPTLVREQLPGAELLVLTVNERNPAAVRAYLRGGFVDTGARYLGGGAGPQHVLVAAVPHPGASGQPA